ncbi:MAG: polyprenyl synthetase family protein [Pyrinomonadaceae bacterium]
MNSIKLQFSFFAKLIFGVFAETLCTLLRERDILRVKSGSPRVSKGVSITKISRPCPTRGLPPLFMVMNQLEIFFIESAKAVDEKLNELIPSAQTEPSNLHAAMRWSVFAGGKRLRPTLVLAVGDAFGAAKKDLLNTAAAIEMIHAYSLVHDDLPAMDDDDLRRGRETCHVKFNEATAILAGDVLQTLAFQAIAEDVNLPEKIRVNLIAEIARAAGTPTGMVAGQQLDLEAEGVKISVADLEKIHRNKTGAMIRAAARTGAIIGKASEREIELISNYAERLGLLFQIVDDILDATQTSEILGKTAGKDARANKATYVSLYSLSEAQRLAETVHAQACEEVKKIERETSLLCEMADFILCRES